MSPVAEERQARGEEYAALMEGALIPGGWPLSSHSNVYENSRVVKAGSGRLFGLVAYSSNAAAQFVQVFDAPALPDDGAVPVLVIPVAATAVVSLYYGSVGRWFQRGIVVCNSSTAPTKTIGSADTFFDVQFI
jgi:hypothetical protein